MANIFNEVERKQASANTIYYCLNQYYRLGKSVTQLSKDFCKNKSTISRWIQNYENSGFISRKERAKVYISFNEEKISWIIGLFMKNPTLFLSEAKIQFESEFNEKISIASINRILHVKGFSYKALERRAIQISETQILRFVKEIHSFSWDLSSLLFLDEVSVDNRSIWRKKGYGVVGQKLVYRGEFNRTVRTSLLCFMGQNGIVDYFTTQGTYTRKTFFECCRDFALSGNVVKYPGRHSVWVLDGAKIHCDPHIITYLRSLGIVVVFLPPYCPFFNPIEILFGILKKHITKNYVENNSRSMNLMVFEALLALSKKDCTNLFKKCGFVSNSRFDVKKGLENDKQFVEN
uniref:CSON009017 protein n=1 Tax=Culicoides sonorensis TaxID=179676 RepID=A0A336KGK9_CULSO